MGELRLWVSPSRAPITWLLPGGWSGLHDLLPHSCSLPYARASSPFVFCLEDHCFPEHFNYLQHFKSRLTKATRLAHLWLPMTNPSFIVLHNSWHLTPVVLVIKCLFSCLHCLVQQREMPILTTDECHGELLRFSSDSCRNRERFTETPSVNPFPLAVPLISTFCYVSPSPIKSIRIIGFWIFSFQLNIL